MVPLRRPNLGVVVENKEEIPNRMLVWPVESGILQLSSPCWNLVPGLGFWSGDWEEQQPPARATPQRCHLPKDIEIYIFLFFTGGRICLNEAQLKGIYGICLLPTQGGGSDTFGGSPL